ncbi:hypothetical protein Nepgr_008457 [Nepenthes gracilis]|uniref:Myb-like domain-containing protein n=1 Tax=Nepenthes gracilis TaxID=150966 RepID=A0AAD3S9J1_NEPGR|nr:hypothetical protein Nepgr_008457 [Nepenthes gracilis]
MDEFNLWEPTLYDDMNCQAPEDDDRNLEWTYTENKLFEMTLAEELDLNSADLYEKMVARLPGKAVDQIKKHHEALIADVAKIERGEIALPDYKETELVDVNGEDMIMKDERGVTYSFHQRRRRGVPWSEEEHRQY